MKIIWFLCYGHGFVLQMLQYLGLSKLSLQELQSLSVSLLAVLQGDQLLLHLPLQYKQQVSDLGLDFNMTELWI